MLRVVLAAMVPSFAIGMTGLIVTTIGRLLLAVGEQAAVIVALVMTIAIMVVATVLYLVLARRPARPRPAHVRQPAGHH